MRHELRSVLKGAKFKDEDLLQEISDVMVNETEHSEKLHTKLSKANVNTVDSSEKHSESKIKKDKTNLLTEVSKLSAQVGELSGLKEEIENLKSEVQGYKMSKSASPFYPRTFLQSSARRKALCLNCRSANAGNCNHCFFCGDSGHRRYLCPF